MVTWQEVAMFMSFGGGDITGKLRDGAEERIRASSLSGIAGRRIVIESVSITYRLEEPSVVREQLGMSGRLMVIPEERTDELPELQAKRFDDWAV
jgi:hypothetical protein